MADIKTNIQALDDKVSAFSIINTPNAIAPATVASIMRDIKNILADINAGVDGQEAKLQALQQKHTQDKENIDSQFRSVEALHALDIDTINKRLPVQSVMAIVDDEFAPVKDKAVYFISARQVFALLEPDKDSNILSSSWEAFDSFDKADKYGAAVSDPVSRNTIGRRPHNSSLFFIAQTDQLLYFNSLNSTFYIVNRQLEAQINQILNEINEINRNITVTQESVTQCMNVIFNYIDEELTPEFENKINEAKTELTTKIDEAKRTLFDDMWKTAFGEYGDVDHSHMENGKPAPYYGNELWMTYEEALEVDSAGHLQCADNRNRYYRTLNLRTVLPAINQSVLSKLEDCFNQCMKLEKVRLSKYEARLTSINNAFSNCSSLTHILGDINFEGISQIGVDTFKNCSALYQFNFKRVNSDISFKSSSKLAAEPIRNLIANRAGTNTFTLTLHADVYAKIIADEGEWQGILDLAQQKNISIASA